MAEGTSSRVAAGLGGDALRPMAAVKSIVRGFEDKPLPDFAEAIADIVDAGVIPDVQDMAGITYESAKDAKTYGKLKDDPPDVDGVAILMKYSAEDSDPPIYKDMNDKCYNSDRTQVKVYAKFLWLFVKTLQLLQPYPSDTVFRGVKADLRSDYPVGREFTWHSPTSCTKNLEVLSTPMFCGQTGARTIFVVKLTQGQARDITRYSLIPSEDEVVLPPGCRFKVESVLPQGDLTIVQLIEIPSREWFVDISHPSSCGRAPGAAPAPAPCFQEKQEVDLSPTWVPVSKGDPLPAGAFLAGHYGPDGVLYVGRFNGEVGKYNVATEMPGGDVHNLWLHGQGRQDSGEILVVPSGMTASWEPYTKGGNLPAGAFQAGHWHKDGVLYVGKVAGGEIGKINMSNDKCTGQMHNLWVQSSWFASTTGSILCIR